MKKTIKLLLILLLLPSLSQACLWLEGTTIEGEHKTFEDKTISSVFLKSSQHTSQYENFQQKFYRENNQTQEYMALYNIMKGNYNKGIEELLNIENQTPNLYATASNLGTAYELNGDIASAIQWIKEGIKRDSSSHYGTEWLHLLILKTKLKLENNTSILEQTHMIPLPNHFTETTNIKINEKSYTISDIRTALFYQLRERLIFVKPKDKVVADLLYTFAKIEEQTTIVEESKILLSMAIEYGFNNHHNIASLTSTVMETQISYTIKIILYGLGALLLLFILNVLIRKKQKNQIKKSLSPLSFSLSVNAHILLFSILFVPIYASVDSYFNHSLVLYLLLIPFYLIAIYFAFQGFETRNIITNPKKSILYTLLLYIGFILLIYFNFLQYGGSNITYYFTAHTLFALGIFYILKWKLQEKEK